MSEPKVWEGPPIEAWRPQDAAARLAGVTAPWMVVGGWALDLWLGRETREHEDLEIAILREDFPQVRDALAGLDVYAIGDGEVRALPADEAPPPHRHQNWIAQGQAWRMDIMLEPGDAQTWAYRRNPEFTAPRAWMTGTTADGIPYLRPHGVLFFKSKAPRPKDEADLKAALPHFDAESRAWIADAIARFEPQSPWRGRF